MKKFQKFKSFRELPPSIDNKFLQYFTYIISQISFPTIATSAIGNVGWKERRRVRPTIVVEENGDEAAMKYS